MYPVRIWKSIKLRQRLQSWLHYNIWELLRSKSVPQRNSAGRRGLSFGARTMMFPPTWWQAGCHSYKMDGKDSVRGQWRQSGRAQSHPEKIRKQKGKQGENVKQGETRRGWEQWKEKMRNRWMLHKGQARGHFRRTLSGKECGKSDWEGPTKSQSKWVRQVKEWKGPKCFLRFVPIQWPTLRIPGKGTEKKNANNISLWLSAKNENVDRGSGARDSFIRRCW